MKIHLSLERETKNTVRFEEDEKGQPEGHPGANALGKPERISVELGAIDGHSGT